MIIELKFESATASLKIGSSHRLHLFSFLRSVDLKSHSTPSSLDSVL